MNEVKEFVKEHKHGLITGAIVGAAILTGGVAVGLGWLAYNGGLLSLPGSDGDSDDDDTFDYEPEEDIVFTEEKEEE